MLYEKIYDYYLMRLEYLRKRRVFVFGAGRGGKLSILALKKLDVDVINVLDNNANLWNTSLEGVPITSPSVLEKCYSKKCYVLVVLTKANEVANQLETFGCTHLNYDLVLEEIFYRDQEINERFKSLSDLINIKFQQQNELIKYKFKFLESNVLDLNYQMQKIASKETAKFILNNMFHVKQFYKREDLLEFCVNNSSIKGIYLEFGVFEGKSINFISKIKPNEKIYGFDSFEGLPEKWRPGYDEGTFKTNNLPDVNDNVVLIKGYFHETLPDFRRNNKENCAFIHIDCDLYSSTKTILSQLKNQITHGTIIVFDEFFNYPNWQKGEYKAFIEYVESNNLKYEYLGYMYKGYSVGIRIL